MLQQMFEVTAARFLPRSNADVCVTDRQCRRRYSAADRTNRQSDVASDRPGLGSPFCTLDPASHPRSCSLPGWGLGCLATCLGVMNCGVERRRKSTVSRARCAGALSCWKIKVISSDLLYCWQHLFCQQLISVIGAIVPSSGLDENQIRAPELAHGDRHHQRLAERWTCTE